jgi:hypothetical protein
MPNPRGMKRFVNSYSALRDVRIMEGNQVLREPLALWTILETRWPSLADYLRTAPEAIELLGNPADELEAVPSELRILFADPAVIRLANFDHGGPLTPAAINACCGAEQSQPAWPEQVASAPEKTTESGQTSIVNDSATGETVADTP